MGGKPNKKQEKEPPLISKGKGYNTEQMINGKLHDEIFNTGSGTVNGSRSQFKTF